MKRIFFNSKGFVTLVIAFSLVIFSCREDDKEGPKMIIDKTTLALTSTENTDDFIITNIGDETLEWWIENKPRWIDLSNLLGNLKPGSEKIVVIADIDSELDTYDGEIEIKSNAGDHTINVSFEHGLQVVGIYPGSGVDNIQLGEKYSNLKQEYGIPDDSVVIQDDYIDQYGKTRYYWLGYVDYSDLGMGFYFDCGDSNYISESFDFFLIEIDKPYSRKTSKGIGVNSTIEDVENAYNMPPAGDIETYEEDGYGIYYYFSKGISFIYNLDTDKLLAIWVHFIRQKSSASFIKKLGSEFHK